MNNNTGDPSGRASIFSVDYTTITLEELAEHKMDKGAEKYQNPDNYTTGAMMMRYLRHIGEFIVSMEDLNYSEMMEYIADVQNVGALLFPKLQEEMIQKEYEENMMNEELNNKGPN